MELGQQNDSVLYHTLKCVSDVSHEYTMNTNMYSVYRLLLRLNASECIRCITEQMCYPTVKYVLHAFAVFNIIIIITTLL